MRRTEKDNRGYSLVEAIIVVAVISVIGVTAALSISLVFNTNAKTCANDIMGAISECRIMTMSSGKGNVRLIIYRDGANGNIFCELQMRESQTSSWVTSGDGAQKIGAGKCQVGTSDGANDVPQSRDSAWKIYFDRSSGSLITTGSDKTSPEAENIYVTGGNRHYLIRIERLTGKQILEIIP